MPVITKAMEALQIRELRNRIGFTLLAILIFRVGCRIPTPGVDPAAMSQLINDAGSVLGFFNLVSGGALESLSIFALGIAPFINASIVMQLLTFVVPSLNHLAKEEGQDGRKTIERYTRWAAVGLGAMQAFGVCIMLEGWQGRSGAAIVTHPGWHFRIVAATSLTLGSAFVMWLSELMTKRGIGNGASVLITSGIVSRLPAAALIVGQAFELDHLQPVGVLKFLCLLALTVLATAGVVAMQDGVRKIPVQHSRRIAGRRVFGGAATHIPLKVNQGGVMPVIFASSVMTLPLLLLRYANARWSWEPLQLMQNFLLPGRWGYLTFEFVLIIFFAYFYAAIQFDPREVAENLKKSGAFAPGVRAGRRTAEYMDRILNRITLAGGFFLGLLALVPQLMVLLFGSGLEAVGLGGTSLLIVVGVILDTVRQVESQMVARNYHAFMRA